MKSKNGYKLVQLKPRWLEVEIPDEWEIKTFDDLFEFLTTGSNPRSDLVENGDIQYIHYGDIHQKWNLILDCDSEKIPYINKTKVERIPLLKDGDLIIADASEDYEGSGASILLKNVKNKKIVSGLHTLALRNKDESLSLDFNAYLTSIRAVRQQIISYVTGMSVYGLSKHNLKQIRIPYPTPPEQRKIVSILSDINELIQQTNRMIDQIKLLKKGLMQKLLTKGIGHAKFKKIKWYFQKEISIPEKWDVKLLSELGELSAGATPSTKEKKFWENGTIPWLQSGEIDNNRITSTEKKITKLGLQAISSRLFRKNTVVIAITGFGNVRGKTSLLEIDTSANQSVVGIVPNHTIDSEYLWYYLQYRYELLRNFAQGTQQPGLPMDILEKFYIIYPKLKQEQRNIVLLLSMIDSRIQNTKKYNSKLKTLKRGLTQKLLTGQVRVKV